MKYKTKRITLALSIVLASTLATSNAEAEDSGIIVSPTLVKPLFEDGTVTESSGLGGDLVLMDDEIFMAIGGWGVVGRPDNNKIRRDIFDLHLNVGFRPDKDGAFIPFMSIGLDVLTMTTHEKTRTLRGTTLGLNAMIGVAGMIGDEGWIYKVNGSYLGAIVPGTGDDLGGLVLQAGIGKMFD